MIKLIKYMLFLSIIFVFSCDDEKSIVNNDEKIIEESITISDIWLDSNTTYLYNFEFINKDEFGKHYIYSEAMKIKTYKAIINENKIEQSYRTNSYYGFNSSFSFDSNFIISKHGSVFVFDSTYSLVETNDTICRFDLDKWIVSEPIVLENNNNSKLYILKEAEILKDSIFYYNDLPINSKTIEIKHFEITETNSVIIEKKLVKKEVFHFAKKLGIIHYKIENFIFDSKIVYDDSDYVSVEFYLINKEKNNF